MKLSKAAVITLTTLALATGAVGCNSAATNATSSATTNAAAAPSAKAPASTGTSGHSSPASTRCHTGELKADLQIQRDGSAMVMLTNKGSRTCTVYGYLGYGGLLADNSPVEVATKRVAYPGASVSSTLKPGTTAFSGLQWASCSKSEATCKVLAGVTVTPPDETTQLTATVLGLDGKPVQQLLVSAAGFTVGTLQPSNEGVTFQ